MNKIYFISDIHGEYDIFIEMLEKINFDETDTLYILGDVNDRGPDSFKVINYVREHNNIIHLMGNHEQMMLYSLKYNDKSYEKCWLKNGGLQVKYEFDKLTETEQMDILEYIENLPRFKLLEFNENLYFLCHAGIIPTDDKNLNDMVCWQGENLLWVKSEFLSSNIVTPFYIVFGHTPTSEIPNYDYSLTEDQIKICEKSKILKWKNRIALDCACCFGDNLGCYCLTDDTEFYVKNYKEKIND